MAVDEALHRNMTLKSIALVSKQSVELTHLIQLLNLVESTDKLVIDKQQRGHPLAGLSRNRRREHKRKKAEIAVHCFVRTPANCKSKPDSRLAQPGARRARAAGSGQGVGWESAERREEA